MSLKYDKDSDKIKHKNYKIEPSFNYVKGTIEQISRISYSNIYIKQVISHIIYILPEIVQYNVDVEIKASQYNYSVIIHGFIDMLNVYKFINSPFELELVYLKTQINAKKYKIHIYKSFNSMHKLTYSPEMFIYTDDNTNNKIITTLLEKRFDTENYCFIGGNSIIYCKCFEYKYAVFYTDSYFIDKYFMINVIKHKFDESKILKKYINFNNFNLSFHFNNTYIRYAKYSIVYEINDTHNYYNILLHLGKLLPQYLYLIIPLKLKDDIPFYILYNAGYTITHVIYIDNTYSPIYIIILS